MVTSLKMIEKEMGYRGSKSIPGLRWNRKPVIVKEQRVDGSWLLNKIAVPNRSLRCTLMGFERNSQIKVLTKQLISRAYTTSVNEEKISSWFLTGFTDAEGSFIISIYRNGTKWRVSPYFCIHIHMKDLPLLKQIQETLGVGKVRKNNEKTVLFRVNNIKELQVIIDHFEKYPLLSGKYSDYLLFKQCYHLIKNKKHLTKKGFEEILALRCNLNKSYSEELRLAFPNIVPIDRPKHSPEKIPDPLWVSGFASGDFSFSVSLEKSTRKVEKRVRLVFGTCLHKRDKDLLVVMGPCSAYI